MSKMFDRVAGGSIFGCLGVSIITSLLVIAAWVTHVVSCIKAGAILLLVVGAVFAPVGVIHGIMIWFGTPWTT